MQPTRPSSRLSDLHTALGYVVLLQVVILLFTAMILDGGYCGRVCGAAMVGYWLMVGWFAIRRRNALTKADVVLIRSGFLLWLGIAILVQIGLEYFSHG